MTSTAARAARLFQLHQAEPILSVVNVWDVISARVIADLPGTTALATASHSIAASLGYEDGENIPVEEMITAVGRIAAATDLPVSADLESGYGDAGETVRRAIDVGIVGANLEDQLKPLDEAVAAVAAVVAAGEAAGVPFVLNARTDAYVRGGDRPADVVLADAVERGTAFLDAGAACVFVPGMLKAEEVATLVGAFGPGRLSLINLPGGLSVRQMADLGVARVSVGPWSQRVALTALKSLAEEILSGGGVPTDAEPLN